jgi:hypothetical protein
VIQVILAGWNNFRSMVTGLDVLPKDAINDLQLATVTGTMGKKEILPPDPISAGPEKISKQPGITSEMALPAENILSESLDEHKERITNEIDTTQDKKIILKPDSPDKETESNEL